ncbi:hypothetical protein JMJ56_08850 [Belnapia sp. T18]|uniref:Sel1 repeat-containing protein n=1 Tax=Belnapia arida TaxID=2804533 RepID=A0ABS1U0A2_9PROT|nr:hypothetical protein [Belnapia arida]MBL6078113.1 hypothetical protein [Belnapia arida]
MRHDPAEAGMFTPIADVGSFDLRAGKAGPVPSGDFLAATLAAVVAEMQPGWVVLRDCLLEADGTYGPGLIRCALLHNKVGIALLDFVPGDVTPDAGLRLRTMLDAAGFRTKFGRYPPIIYLCIPKRTVPGLAWVLEHEFSKQESKAVPRDGAWTHLAQQVLAGEWKHRPLAPAAASGAGQDIISPKVRRQPAGGRRSRWLTGFACLLALTLAGTAVLHFEAPAGSRMAMPGPGAPDGAAGPLSQLPHTDNDGRLASGLAAAEPPGTASASLDDSLLTSRMAEEPRLAAPYTSGLQEDPNDGSSSPAPFREADPQAAHVAASALPLWERPTIVGPGDDQMSGADPTRMAASVPDLSDMQVQAETVQALGVTPPADGDGANAPSPAPVPSPYLANLEVWPAQAAATNTAASEPAERPQPPDPSASGGASNENAAVAADRAVLPAGDAPPVVGTPVERVPGQVAENPTAAPADEPVESRDQPPIPTAMAPRPDVPTSTGASSADLDIQMQFGVSTARMRDDSAPLPPADVSVGMSKAEGVLPGSASLRGSGDEAAGASAEAHRKPADGAEVGPPPDSRTPERQRIGDAQPQPEAALSQASPPMIASTPARHAEQPSAVTAAMTSPSTTEPQAAPPPGNPALARAIIQRGDAMIRLGDISAARLLYQRAATAGSGQAAIAMGRTYDPAFLASTRAQGIQGDRALAATWYRQALALGITEAKDRLAELGIHD